MEEIRSTAALIAFLADGGQPKYLMFWGHQPPPGGSVGRGCLSQWWPVTFTVDGVAYASAEHYMMRAKALLFGDADTAGRIVATPHPGAAKALGREVRGFDEERWNERRFEIVVDRPYGTPPCRGSAGWDRSSVKALIRAQTAERS